jgi:iron complex transport system ATP-binding protein
MLAGSNLHVSLDAVAVLHGVSISAAPGEIVGLIGPNGAGKSTLLRTLAGIELPSQGTVELRGRDITAIKAAQRARQIAYLPQASEVYWPLSVANLVGLGRVPYRKLFASLSQVDEQAIESALAKTELQTLRTRTVGTLSGGERMRALVARMLAVEADILLVDEPVAGLDPYYQIQFMDVFAAEARQGRAVVLVLHDLSLAARHCDRVVLLDAGKVAASGTPEEVLTKDQISAVYRVEALRDQHEGELLVLPWRRTQPDSVDTKTVDRR